MDYRVLAPLQGSTGSLCEQKPLLPFDHTVLDFIDALSKEILGSGSYRSFPELVSMAYWMRKTQIRKLKKDFEEKSADSLRLGRGVVLHIAPSNVDTIFIYSWFLSMLAGNLNIIRISEKGSPQMKVLLDCINELCDLPQFEEVVKRFIVLTYGHDEEITAHFSSLCDMRVIWGGDTAVNTIRKIPLKPHAAEMTFPDRTSLSLIRAGKFLEQSQKNKVVDNFYNDAYWFNQMACASPRIVVWVGNDEEIERAREVFWSMLEEKVMRERPNIEAATIIDKLVSEYSLAILRPDIRIEKSRSNLVNRILFADPTDMMADRHCGGGLFFEVKMGAVDQIAGMITSKIQSVAVFGFTSMELKDFMIDHRPPGVDRFVAMGQALTFSDHWDGHDLLRDFCREVVIDV